MAGGRTKDDYTECTGNGQQQFLVGKVYTLDFGVDFGFFDNRFNGTFDWYRRDTKGMLAPGMDLPWVVGATAAKQNAADLKTYGWELELNWRDRINKDWSYRIGFNHDSDKVKSRNTIMRPTC